MVDFTDRVFFDVKTFRDTFIEGMAQTLDIEKSRLYIVRIRQASNKDWPQIETTTTMPTRTDSPDAADEVEEAAVEDRAVVEFWILDPPAGINGEKPIHWASEKARRLAALLASESRGAWKGGLLSYI